MVWALVGIVLLVWLALGLLRANHHINRVLAHCDRPLDCGPDDIA